MDEIVLELPWPPSMNGVWRSVGGRVLLSAKARNYRLHVLSLLAGLKAKKVLPVEPLKKKLKVSIEFFPPDKRARDLDNMTKAMFDALTKGQFWVDDKLVREEHKYWADPVRGGKVILTVEALQ